MMCKLFTSCSLVLTVILAGCGGGPETGEVKGKVTFDGRTVTVGSISFTTDDGVHTTGANIQSNGSFEFEEGVVVGTHVVEYEPPFAEDEEDEGWEQAKDFLECNVAWDFRAKVVAGENTIDIKLIIRGPPPKDPDDDDDDDDDV